MRNLDKSQTPTTLTPTTLGRPQRHTRSRATGVVLPEGPGPQHFLLLGKK